MWDPLLRRDLEHCTLVDSQVIDGRPSVFCILDPPRYAVGEKPYETAQRNAALLFEELPHETVALQREFFQDYLEKRSLGIAMAIAGSKKPPLVLPVEDSDPRAHIQTLTSRAVERMTLATPFFNSLIHAFDQLASGNHTPFSTIKQLHDDHRDRKVSFAAYLRQMMDIARSQGQSVPFELVLAAKAMELTPLLHAAAINLEQQRLEQDITARAEAHAFSPRAAVELYLYVLESTRGRKPEHENTINACRALLEEPEPPVDDWVVREVADAIASQMGDFLGPAVRLDPDQQHRPHLGHGEVVSRMIELAPLLDIDVNRYPTLQLYLRHSYILHRLSTLRASGLALGMAEALRRLETDVLFAAASDDRERELIALMPVMELLKELRQFRIGYGDAAREALAGFSAVDLCRRLDAIGANLQAKLHAEAKEVDGWMRDVIELGEESIRRGKLLAARLLAEIESRQLSSVLLVCDAYLYDVVVGELGDAVSYSMLMPDFSLDQ